MTIIDELELHCKISHIKDTNNYSMYSQKIDTDWFIDYLVYEDRVQLIEYKNGKDFNKEAVCENVSDILEIAKEWAEG